MRHGASDEIETSKGKSSGPKSMPAGTHYETAFRLCPSPSFGDGTKSVIDFGIRGRSAMHRAGPVLFLARAAASRMPTREARTIDLGDAKANLGTNRTNELPVNRWTFSAVERAKIGYWLIEQYPKSPACAGLLRSRPQKLFTCDATRIRINDYARGR
jgi:hypothetical protein